MGRFNDINQVMLVINIDADNQGTREVANRQPTSRKTDRHFCCELILPFFLIDTTQPCDIKLSYKQNAVDRQNEKGLFGRKKPKKELIKSPLCAQGRHLQCNGRDCECECHFL